MPPTIRKPMRSWSFKEVCRQVQLEHPEWTEEHVGFIVEKENAERILAHHPNATRYVVIDDAPDKTASIVSDSRSSQQKVFNNPGLLLVLPFCSRETSLLTKLLQWMRQLDPGTRMDVLLAYDLGTNLREVRLIKEAVISMCSNWAEICYPVPPRHYFAPNWAFQCVARFISASTTRPWIWFEADMTPLKPGWLATLQAAYISAKKPCMGVLVPGMGHMNGTAIYPHDYAKWAVHAMTCTGSAWDMEQIKDTMGKVHEASYLMQHVWGIVNGHPHPSQGAPPSFQTEAQMAWINPDAVTFHRCKDGSLIDRLRERKK